MSSTDDRIVKMTFDNKQFEEGIRQTTDSLDKLEQSLKLDDATKSLENVEKQFSTMSIVGMSAIHKLTTAALTAGKKIIDKVYEPFFEGGKRRVANIQQAQFLFKGLGIDIEEAMANAEEASFGTSFGLDEAALAAARLATSGTALGKDMTLALGGISDVASMTNSSFGDIADIFATIASNGRLMTHQVRQFSFRGLNMTAILAKQLNTTEAEIQKRLSSKKADDWISWETFYNSLDGAFGDVSKRADETLEGATSRARYSWIRMGEKFWAAAAESSRQVQLALRPFVNELSESLNPIVSVFKMFKEEIASAKLNFMESFNLASLREFMAGFANIGLAIYDTIQIIKDAWSMVFPKKVSDGASNLSKGFRSLTERLIPTADQAEKLERIFKGLFSGLGIFIDILKGVGQVLKAFLEPIFDSFGKTTNSLGGGLLEIAAKIGDAIVRLREWLKESKVFNAIAKAVGTAMGWLVDKISKLVNTIKDSGIIPIFITTVSEAFKSLKNNITEFINSRDFKNFVKDIKDKFGDLKTFFDETFNGIGIEWRKFKDAITGPDGQIDFTKVNESFKEFRKNIGARLKEIGKSFTGSGPVIFGFFKDFINGIKDGWKDLKENTNIGELFGDIGEWLSNINWGGIIAAVLTGGILKTVSDLKVEILKPISDAFSTGFKDVAKSLKGFINAKKMETYSIALRNLAIAIAILAASLIALSLADLDKVQRAAEILIVLFAALGTVYGIVLAISKTGTAKGPLSSVGMATSILALAAGILLIVAALKKLEGIDVSDMGLQVALLASVIVTFAGIAKILSMGGGLKLKGFLLFTAGIYVLTLSIKKMTTIDLTGSEKNIESVMLIIIALMAMAKLLSIGKNSGKGAKSILAIGGSVLMIAIALEKIAKIDSANLTKALVTVGVLIAMMTVFTVFDKLIGMIGKKSNSVSPLLEMAGAILIISFALKKIAKIDASDLTKAVLAIGALMTLIGVFTILDKAASSIGGDSSKTMAPLLKMAASVLVLAVSLKMLSSIEPDRLLGSTIVLASLIGMVTLFARFAGESDKANKNLGKLTVIIVSLSLLIIAMSFIDPLKLIPATLAVDSLLLMLVVLIKAADDVDLAWGTVAKLGIVLAMLGGIIYLISNIKNTDAALEASMAMSLILLAAAGAIRITAGINASAASAAADGIGKFILKLALVFGIILLVAGAIFAGLGALDNLFDGRIVEVIEKGVAISVAIADGLGQIFKTIVDAVAEAILDQFPKIGTALSEFAVNLQPFTEIITNMPDNFLANAGAVVAAILLFAGAQLIDGIVNFLPFSSSLVEIGEKLVDFGPCLKAFYDEIKDIDPEVMSSATGVMVGFAALMTAMPTSGGLSGWLLGESDSLDDFSEKMVVFGEGLKSFEESIAPGIDEAVVKSAVGAGEALAGLNKSLPRSGGKLQDFIGEQDMGKFGTDIEGFGKAIVRFQNTLPADGIDEDVVGSAASAGMMLSELNNSLPKTGGKLQDFLGEQDMHKFGNDMFSFATALVLFIGTLKPGGKSVLDTELVEEAAIAGNMLSELQNTLPDTGGWKQTILGETTTLSDFGTNLVSLAGSLSSFSDSLQDVDFTIIEAVTPLLNDLTKIDVGGKGGFFSLFSRDNDLGDFGGQLKKLGQGFSSFSEELSGGEFDESVITAAIEIMNSMIDTFGDANFEMFNAGSMNLKAFVEGMYLERYNVDATSSEIAQVAVDAINDINKNFELAGKNSVQGFANGVRLYTYIASAAAYNMGISALESAKDALEISSPSEAFKRDVGQMISRGVAEGVTKDVGKVDGAMSQVGNTIKSHGEQWIATRKRQGRLSAEEERYARNQISSAISSSNAKDVNNVNKTGQQITTSTTKTSNNVISTVKKTGSQASKITKETLKEIEEAVKNAETKWLNDQKHFNKITIDEELAFWKERMNTSKKGSEEQMEAAQQIYTLERQLQEESFEALKKYSRITITEEIEYWQARVSAATKGTKEYNDAVGQIYDLELQRSNDWLDDMKFYKKISLADELAFYKGRQALYKKDTVEYKKYSRLIFSLEEEINQNIKNYHKERNQITKNANNEKENLEKEHNQAIKDLNEQLVKDIESVNKSYDDTLKSREDAIYGAFGLFEKLEDKDRNSGFDLVKNLEGQIEELEEWTYLLDALERKNLSEVLIDELEKMGPSAIAELRGLNELTAGELVTYENLWNKKRDLAKSQAIKELKEVRIEADKEITNLNSNHSVKLKELEDLYDESLTNINTQLSDDLLELNKNFLESMGMLDDDAKEGTETLAETLAEGFENVKDKIKPKLEGIEEMIAASAISAALELSEIVSSTEKGSFQDSGKTTVDKFAEGLSLSEYKAEATAKTIAEAAVKGLQSGSSGAKGAGTDTGGSYLGGLKETNLEDESYKIGIKGSDGLILGLSEQIDRIMALGNKVPKAYLRALKDGFDIQSPSRETYRIGGLVGLGLVNALQDYRKKSELAGEELGESTLIGLKETMAMVEKLLEDDNLNQPVIRPVVDLDGVIKGVDGINDLLNINKRYSLMLADSTAISMDGFNRKLNVCNTIDTINKRLDALSTTAKMGPQFVQNNYSPKALSRIDIYRQTKNQFTAAKGVLDKV